MLGSVCASSGGAVHAKTLSWVRTSASVARPADDSSGDTQAWLAAHLTLAVALRLMRRELPGVDNTRAAAALLQQILLQAHSEIMQVGRPAGRLRTCQTTALLQASQQDHADAR